MIYKTEEAVMNFKIMGCVMMVMGVVLLIFGWNSSQSIPDQVTEQVTGRFTQPTMLYILGGLALLVGGGALTFYKKGNP